MGGIGGVLWGFVGVMGVIGVIGNYLSALTTLTTLTPQNTSLRPYVITAQKFDISINFAYFCGPDAGCFPSTFGTIRIDLPLPCCGCK